MSRFMFAMHELLRRTKVYRMSVRRGKWEEKLKIVDSHFKADLIYDGLINKYFKIMVKCETKQRQFKVNLEKF